MIQEMKSTEKIHIKNEIQDKKLINRFDLDKEEPVRETTGKKKRIKSTDNSRSFYELKSLNSITERVEEIEF